MSLWATLISLVAREEGTERHGRWGRTRDPGAPRSSGPGKAAPRTRSSHSEGTQAPGAGRRRFPPRTGAGALRCPRSPGPPRPVPAASAPGAQVWAGRQVQSALAPCHLPSRAPALRYLRVERGHRHGRDGPEQLEGREGARLRD